MSGRVTDTELREMLEGISRTGWVGWEAYFMLEPFGGQIEAYRHEVLCSAATEFRVPSSVFAHKPDLEGLPGAPQGSSSRQTPAQIHSSLHGGG